MAEITEDQRRIFSWAFWGVAVVLLGVWFYSESQATKRAIREESSMLFSNLVVEFKNITSSTDDFKIQEATVDANSKLHEVAERFKSESNRLSTDFDGMAYSNLGFLLNSAYHLSKGSEDQLEKLEELSMKESNFNKKPLEFLEKEIGALIKARTLIAANDEVKFKQGQESLIKIMETAKVVPIDAATSYVISLKSSQVSNEDLKKQAYKPVRDLVLHRPELRDDLVSELSRYGIFVDLS